MFDARCAVGESKRIVDVSEKPSRRSSFYMVVDNVPRLRWFDDGADHEGKAILIWCVGVLMMRGFFARNDRAGTVLAAGGS